MMQLESRCPVRAPGGEMAIAHAKPAEAMGSPTEAAGSIFFSYTSSCTGGVGIVFSKNFLPVSCKAEEIIKGCQI